MFAEGLSKAGIGLTVWLLAAGLLIGCVSPVGKKGSADQTAAIPAEAMAPKDKFRVYIFREANYKGGGRIHQLQLDEKTLGSLTGSNYYRLTLWPGHYYLTVHLPAESFLGENNPPMSIAEPLRLDARQAGSTLIYTYTDGEGFRHTPASTGSMIDLTAQRTMAADLSARDTARLKEFMDTRFDGPEMFGSPNGLGTLSWPDGSRYVGVFDHGVPTPEGHFYYPDGTIYMGQLFQCRPKGAGVLMSADGQVLFAGRFLDEKPHGEGIRTGKDGPELCVFDKGQDVTQTIKELTTESVTDQEAQLLDFIYSDEPAADGSDNAVELTEMLEADTGTDEAHSVLPPPASTEAPKQESATASPQESPKESPSEGQAAAATEPPLVKVQEEQGEPPPETLSKDQFQKMLEQTRLHRRWALRAMIVEEQKARITERREWCEKERRFGRKWCVCAPFDPDAGQWRECKR